VGTVIWLEDPKLFSEIPTHMFRNEGGQKRLVRDTKGQWGSKEKDVYRAGSEKGSFLK
jgi:hypothetical protein